jgi:peptide-methionine (R)-S-oxide reductase
MKLWEVRDNSSSFLPIILRYIKGMKNSLSRRYFLGSAIGLAAMTFLSGPAAAALDDYVRFNFIRKRGDNFPFKLSEDEWRKRLGDEGYRILRDGENERAGTSPLLKERRKGSYSCGGCGTKIFTSTAKVMSNDFPTFRAPVARKVIGLSTDFGIILPRTEVHCANCGGHLGYRFAADNAAETWRFAINGTALRFNLN